MADQTKIMTEDHPLGGVSSQFLEQHAPSSPSILDGLKKPISTEDVRKSIFLSMLRDIAMLAHFLGFKSVFGSGGPEDREKVVYKPVRSWIADAIAPSHEDNWEYLDTPGAVGTLYSYVETGEVQGEGKTKVTGPAFSPFTATVYVDPRIDERTTISFSHMAFVPEEVIYGDMVTSEPQPETISSVTVDNANGTNSVRTTLTLEYTSQSSIDSVLSKHWDHSTNWSLTFSQTINIGSAQGFFPPASLSFNESIGGSSTTGGSESQSKTAQASRSTTISNEVVTDPHMRAKYSVKSQNYDCAIPFKSDVRLRFAVTLRGRLRCGGGMNHFDEGGNYHDQYGARGYMETPVVELTLGGPDTAWWEDLQFKVDNNSAPWNWKACLEQSHHFKSLVNQITSEDDYGSKAKFPIEGVLGGVSRRNVQFVTETVDPAFGPDGDEATITP